MSGHRKGAERVAHDLDERFIIAARTLVELVSFHLTSGDREAAARQVVASTDLPVALAAREAARALERAESETSKAITAMLGPEPGAQDYDA